ncbi:hypothetical protein GCM10010300_01050 [Streptomyces olivaceoviridis]|nr:hypothetical protein GCM10010300_01050 [Streptomyces olivaceoviridis]
MPPAHVTEPTEKGPVPETDVGPILPPEDEFTLSPPGETVKVPLAAKPLPVRLPPETRQLWFGAAEADSIAPTVIPPTSTAMAAALSTDFPRMKLSFAGAVIQRPETFPSG